MSDSLGSLLKNHSSAEAAPTPTRVELGVASSEDLPRTRSFARELSIDGETVTLAMLVDGDADLVQWCDERCCEIVIGACVDATAESLKRAAKAFISEAHAQGRKHLSAGACCEITVVLLNRVRQQITSCNVGGCAAKCFSRSSDAGSRALPLTSDHTFERSGSERARVISLGGRIDRETDPVTSRKVGPLRLLPSGYTSGRAIGAESSLIDATPTCSTVPLPMGGTDILICPIAVWEVP